MYYKFYLASSSRREYFRKQSTADLCWCKCHIFQSSDVTNYYCFISFLKKNLTSKKCQYQNLQFLVNVVAHFEKMQDLHLDTNRRLKTEYQLMHKSCSKHHKWRRQIIIFVTVFKAILLCENSNYLFYICLYMFTFPFLPPPCHTPTGTVRISGRFLVSDKW